MKDTVFRKFATIIFLLIASSPLFAQNDMAGSRDHPKIPRIEGAVIYGYSYSDYDAGDFITVFANGDQSLTIYVVGDTDNQGEYDYNLNLSNRRAAAVVKALIDDHGIAQTRLIPVGVGPVSPVASNRTEEGQALNRRVELVGE